MKTLFEQIQFDRVTMRGNKELVQEYNILTLLVGELETASKRDGSKVTEEKVVAAAKKLIKSNNESIKLLGVSVKSVDLTKQNTWLQSYIPLEMTEEKIRSILQLQHANGSFSNIGEAMQFMSRNHAGQFDKGLASKVARELF